MASSTSLVRDLESAVNSFRNEVSTEAQKVKVALNKIDVTVKNVDKQINELRKNIINQEESQIAHENVIKIEHQINEQLKSYQVVRRSVIGVIRDLDINLARNSTISQLSEELWMSSSRYWLSYAFIAISAWVQDNPEICNNALTEALRRDPVKTSLFFCLLNLRFEKQAAAKDWLYEYFGAVDPAHPPRETALLLQAYLYGAFANDSQLDNFVQSTVDKWVTELNTDTAIAAELVSVYNKYIENLPTTSHNFSSDILDDHCANVSELYEALNRASRYRSALTRVDKLDKVDDFTGDSDFIKRIDKILDDLITNYDEEEINLRNKQEFYKLIMAHKGDKEAAQKEYKAMALDVETPNIGRQMFDWAVYAKNVDVSVQKFALQKTKGWYMDAVKSYDHALKTSMPGSFKLKIDLWEDTTDGKDREAIKKNLKDKFMEERSKLLVYTKPNIILGVLAIVFLIVGCVFAMIIPTDWAWYGYLVGGGLFLVFGAIVVVMTVLKFKQYPKRIAAAQRKLDACLDAIELFRNKFNEVAAVKDDLLKKLEYI